MTRRHDARKGLISKKLGLCLVGPGGIAGMHMRALGALDVCDNLWVVGDIPDATAHFAQEWGFSQATDDLAAPLSDSSVDLVYVTSPNALHATHASAALRAGKHVAVEIPAALTLADAEMLSHLSTTVDRRVLVCHTMRSYPAFRALRDQIAAGELEITQLLSIYAIKRRHNENWTGGTRAWVDNLLWHHGAHVVDAALWVLGMPEPLEVSARAGQRNREFGMTMDLAIGFATEQRTLVSHVLTYNSASDLSEWRLVTDRELMIVADGTLTTIDGKLLVAGSEWWDLRAQDGAIIAAIRNGEPSDFDLEAVMPSMRLLDRCQQLSGVV